MFVKRMMPGVKIKPRISLQRRHPLWDIFIDAKRQVEEGLNLFFIGEVDLKDIHRNV
jgi:hypothetical protein